MVKEGIWDKMPKVNEKVRRMKRMDDQKKREDMINFTDLFLLIGTNPLPNYVVAKYFLENNPVLKRIWLIYSEENGVQASTSEVAGRIQSLLQREIEGSNKKIIFPGNIPLSDVGSARDINNDLKDIDGELKKLGATRLHLDYTGGTKAMAVHVYQYFKGKTHLEVGFSYLDGRNCILQFDSGKQVNMLGEIQLNNEGIIELHGYRYEDKKGYRNHKALVEFAQIINEGKIDKYLDWKQEFIRNLFYNEKGLIKAKNKYQENLQRQLKMENGEVKVNPWTGFLDNEIANRILNAAEILTIFRDIYDNGIDNLKNNSEYEQRYAILADFLDGKWLECYVHDVIERGIASSPELLKKQKSGFIEISYSKDLKLASGIGFELDGLVRNGYQLTVISCTTDRSKSLCKSKGFEVWHRAEQIGGEEAKSILITCMDENMVLELDRDLRTISGFTKNKLLVLGKKDLERNELWRIIKGHIWRE